MTATHELTPDTTRWYDDTNSYAETVAFNGRRWGIGEVPPGVEHRKEYRGPLVPGPWAFAFELATVISDPPPPPETRVEVAKCDVLVLSGRPYRVSEGPAGELELDLDEWAAVEA